MAPIQSVLKRWLSNVRGRLNEGARDDGGAVAVIFALALVVLAPLVVGVVDIYLSSSQRSRLQDALDAAALYTARSNATSEAAVSEIGRRALLANLSAADQARLVSTNFTLNGSTVLASAELSPQSIASGLWNHGNMRVNTNVVRSSNNLEVAMVLDITGSMSGDIDSLKSAANDLVDLVVQDTQSPYYSKLAIVPYSNAVNVGANHIDAARGAVHAGVQITGATKANPVVVTAANHGYSNGDIVYINGVTGMTQLNGNTYQVANKTTDTFQLRTTSGYNVDGRYYGTFSSNPDGKVYCTAYGCEYYRFTSASGSTKLYAAGAKCVTERTGTYKYSDTAPGTAQVGFLYTANKDDCPAVEIKPLSTDKTALKATVAQLSASGSTAGHLGVAWGWYMISPNFGSLWSDPSSRPAAYGADELLKVMVLMTDGEFNTAYCHGVLANNSGFGSNSSQINCNAENDTSTNQARALCTNMKAQGVIIYTVGFRINSGSTEANLLAHCATDADHQYLPTSGSDLQDAFRAIGQDINSLRLSH